MTWANTLTQSDKDEMEMDLCDAFQKTIIDEEEFRKCLRELGYNATDIEDRVRMNAPQP